ncbi:hypothetical protein WJX74_009446 [Apatococcus lobatus]|uniref:BFN domain-containing protein n=1 Tax=Apatococcus lobatus TaxID=904363 RepID=A0AAW1SCL5_9CHLO
MICALSDLSTRSLGTAARTPILDTLLARPSGPQLLGSRSAAVMCGQTSVRFMRPLGTRTGKGRGQVTVRAGHHEAYPFDAADYNRVALHIVSAPQEIKDTPSGQLILMRQQLNGYPPDDDLKGLVLGVSGDTLLAVTSQAQRRENSRPLSLDLLWQVLQRGMEMDRPHWQLLRVAIVELRGFTYIGRAFFGDRETGKVAWDCDCRPSDSVWLAQKTHAPIFVHKKVWEQNSSELGRIEQDQLKAHLRHKQQLQEYVLKMEQQYSSLPDQNTYIRHDDPDPVKRLKREMQVALKEEDYASAVRIRDHPFMKLPSTSLSSPARANLCDAGLVYSAMEATAIQPHPAEEFVLLHPYIDTAQKSPKGPLFLGTSDPLFGFVHSAQRCRFQTSARILSYTLLRLVSVFIGFFAYERFQTNLFDKQPSEVTRLYGRTFATWTSVTCALSLTCAYNPRVAGVYGATLFAFAAAFIHFFLELVLFQTISLFNALQTLIPAGISVLWMSVGWNYYTYLAAIEVSEDGADSLKQE